MVDRFWALWWGCLAVLFATAFAALLVMYDRTADVTASAIILAAAQADTIEVLRARPPVVIPYCPAPRRNDMRSLHAIELQ